MQTIEIVKDKIKYRLERFEKAREKLEEEEYNYAQYITRLVELNFDLSSLHNEEELSELKSAVIAYESLQAQKESVAESRWALSNAIRDTKEARRQNSNGPKRGKHNAKR